MIDFNRWFDKVKEKCYNGNIDESDKQFLKVLYKRGDSVKEAIFQIHCLRNNF